MKFIITILLCIILLNSNSLKAEDKQYKFIIESNNDFYVFELNIENRIGFPAMTFLNTSMYDTLMEFTCLVILNPANSTILAAKMQAQLGADVVGMVDKSTQNVSEKYIDGMASAGVAFNSANPNTVMMFYFVQNMNGKILDTNNNTIYTKSCNDVISDQLNSFANMLGETGNYADQVFNEIKKQIFFWN